MKEKITLWMVLCLCFAGLAAAQGADAGQRGIHEPRTGIENPELQEAAQGTGQGLEANVQTETQNQGEESQIRTQQQTQTGNPDMGQQVMAQERAGQQGDGRFTNANGDEMQLSNENGQRLRVRDVEAHSSLELVPEQNQERTQLRAKLSNGKNAEIKVMPDTASARAIERLRLKNCNQENNCSIELKEVGQGEQARAAYEVKAQKQSKVLGLFKAKMRVQAQIDAENGEVIISHKPWWAFLATEPAE